MSHLSYNEFKNRFGDLGITYYVKYNWLANHGLPKGYIAVDYIYTGIQNTMAALNRPVIMVDINNSVSNDFEFGVDFKMDSTSLDCKIAGYGNNITVATLSSRWRIGKTFPQEISSMPIITGQKHNVVVTYDNWNIDGTNYNYSALPLAAHKYALGNWTLSDVNTIPPIYYYGAYYKENGVILSSLMPCVNPDGLVGVYDIITDRFYSSLEGKQPFVADLPITLIS